MADRGGKKEPVIRRRRGFLRAAAGGLIGGICVSCFWRSFAMRARLRLPGSNPSGRF